MRRYEIHYCLDSGDIEMTFIKAEDEGHAIGKLWEIYSNPYIPCEVMDIIDRGEIC